MQRKNKRMVGFQRQNTELPICSSTSSMFPGREKGLHPQGSGTQPHAVPTLPLWPWALRQPQWLHEHSTRSRHGEGGTANLDMDKGCPVLVLPLRREGLIS